MNSFTNTLKTWTLMAALGGIVVAVGGLVGGQSGMVRGWVRGLGMKGGGGWERGGEGARPPGVACFRLMLA